MSWEIFQVDAFAESLFQGNPAAVMVLDEWPDESLLQPIAEENNLSETAYVVSKGKGNYLIRWFTPNGEVDLCGHATLASAHVIAAELGRPEKSLSFMSASGELRVEVMDGHRYRLDFPALSSEPIENPMPNLIHCFEPGQVEACCRGQDIMIILKSLRDVTEARPDLEKWKRLGARGVIISAPSESDKFDFVSRCFYPDCNVPEDPVTGSAHCQLAPYWSKRMGQNHFTAYQASKRGGVLEITYEGDRVLIEGPCITYLRGQISI